MAEPTNAGEADTGATASRTIRRIRFGLVSCYARGVSGPSKAGESAHDFGVVCPSEPDGLFAFVQKGTMGLFNKAKSSVETPFGEGSIIAGDVTVPWKRVHGVLLDLAWPSGTEPNRSLIAEIEDRLEDHLASCEIALGIPDFPAELRCVLPERIVLSGDGDGDFRIVYWCPQWEDGIWGVVFEDHRVIRTYEGD